QNFWVAGGGVVGRGSAGRGDGGRGDGGGGGGEGDSEATPPASARVAVPVTHAGQRFQGVLARIGEFNCTLTAPDGTSRTFRRNGEVPRIDIQDPREAHRKLLPLYTDKDIHDVTAYLVTIK